MRLLRTLLVSGSAVLAAGALAATAGTAASTVAAAPRAVHSATPSARFIAQARVALTSYLRHDHPEAWFTHPGADHAALSSTTKAYSYNWSGYADYSASDNAFTKVTASWVTPKIKCTAEDTLTSEWVGIDGAQSSDPTVEQDGTLDWCFEGKATYFTWYEMYPAATTEVGKALKPGDKITATVTRKGTNYTMAVKDTTHKSASFTTKPISCAASTCLAQTVEWIAERPEFSIGIAPLADYGSWTVTGASQSNGSGKAGSISAASHSESIGMIDATDSYELSTVTGLTKGTSFKTTWKNSY
jgi:hypothetical protein